MGPERDDHAPFILTARLPPDLAAWATELRRRHFPPERNFLAAHVTLFHALPRRHEPEIGRALADLAASAPPPRARLGGILPLGRGTAVRVESPQLLHLRAELAGRFRGLLTSQDQHTPRLHITVQNKVAPAEARALQGVLAGQVPPRDFTFPGLELHIYRGGPWEFVRYWPFRGLKSS